ncbi:MAG: flagellar assembly protein FliX [Candidatus Devosia phytovorans]|uniref:Flagellar assembly protein FliX n=1 Tax=Candidatus Devosia phytovorans TaxID=3121372 RepID=A0AAJ5VXX4_9HYPH|nr:flagellar assembly protein FliX [Devosia sp.]WEK05538.1 MAG: flagellar assembly protein FliX [Devosia sp.]
MRIDTTNRTSGTGRSSAAGRSGSGADFVPAGGAAPSRVATAMPMQAMTGIDSILALQAVDEPLTAKKKAVKRGVSLLDMLEDMRADLLIGQVSVSRLDGMATMLSQLRETSVPGLDSLLDDIELRVRVELAKFGRFPAI